jgi:hypothetical protein
VSDHFTGGSLGYRRISVAICLRRDGWRE